MVQLLIELLKLSALGHDRLEHEERSLDRSEPALVHECKTVVHQCLVQQRDLTYSGRKLSTRQYYECWYVPRKK